MAYTPKTWACGETITADALNHIEQGVESASQVEFFVVHFTDGDNNTKVSDKTAEEIGEAIADGKVPLGIFSLSLGGAPMADDFSFIRRYTGAYSVAFNDHAYITNTGNVWRNFSQ